MSLIAAMVLVGCGGSGAGRTDTGGGTPTPPPTDVDPTTRVSKVVLSTSLGAVKSDDSNQAEVTATLLDSGNAIVVGALATFASNTGVLIVADPKSNTEGKIIGKFSSGTADPATRTATIEVTSNTNKSQLPIRINGSTIELSLVGTPTLPNDGVKSTDMVITVKNAGGTPVNGSQVTIAGAPAGDMTFTPASGVTDANGKFISKAVVVAGKKAGTVTATVNAVGEVRTQAFTITEVATVTPGALVISAVNGASLPPARVVPLSIGSPMTVTVNAASPTTNVTFASSLGGWNGAAASVINVAVVGGVASAILTSSAAGVASVQVYDSAKPTSTETFTAAITAPSTAAAKIKVQVTPNVVPVSGGGQTGTASVIATVTDANDSPVGGAAVAFKIIKAPGGGESINPVIQLTSSVPSADVSLGQAKITFSSGSLSSAQGGVEIQATVVGSNIVTLPNAILTIGGTAGSITFGQATEIAENSNKTAYILPMSVQVADSNGNPLKDTKISLSAWPYAWSTGAGCTYSDTFLNEDANENLILDAGEDGIRELIDGVTFAKSGLLLGGGAKDGKITAINSASGTVPSIVTTDASGLATFDYTYTKSNAIWIVTRIRASALVQGTETVSETKFRLDPLKKDVEPDCLIPNSPYIF